MKQLICWLTMAVPALATAATTDLDGSWAVTTYGKNILIVVIDIDRGEPTPISGTLERPSRAQLARQLVFSNVAGPTHVTPLLDPRITNDRVTFTASSPSDANRRDRFAVTLASPNSAELQLLDTPLPPLALVRVDSSAQVASDWNPELTYRVDDHLGSNSELKRLHDADQAERSQFDKIDPKALSARDAERREKVRKMLNDGKVRTALDFARAALIFQHGSTAEDFLLAHTLTMVSMAKGNADAVWLSSASLDRYLHAIGQPQIYGTQFRQEPGSAMSQGQFNSTLISDEIRQLLGVPPLDEQAQQQRRMEQLMRGNAERR